MKKAWLAALLAGAALACSGPRLPADVTFEGKYLERATDWSREGVQGVAFVPPGERLETASLEIGLLAGSHKTGAELHQWVMGQYRHSTVEQWHESESADEACKVGASPGNAPRPFVALHVCRTGPAGAACAEADERIGDDVVSWCKSRGPGCWDELCTQKWDAHRQPLEALVRQVIGPR